MIRRRATAAGIETKLANHSFRATGITAYLKNGGTLEKAAAMANHASTRTTQLYDRRRDELSLAASQALTTTIFALRARGTERQATARRDPPSLRLARHRPNRAG